MFVIQLCDDAFNYKAFDISSGNALRWRRWGTPVHAHIVAIAHPFLARMCAGELLAMLVEEKSGQEIDVFGTGPHAMLSGTRRYQRLNAIELLPFDDGAVLGRVPLVLVPDFADVDRVLQDRAEMADAERAVAPATVVAPSRDRLNSLAHDELSRWLGPPTEHLGYH